MFGPMSAISRTVTTLRIFGGDLDPIEVTRLLGVEPTICSRKGDPRQTKSGRTVIAQFGSWRLKAASSNSGDLNAQIGELLAEVTDDLSIWQDLTQLYKCDIFCGLFMNETNEGEDLLPKTLSMLGNRGLKLGLDIYGPSK